MILFLVLATCFLAYANGANDNFKGVATLFGSNTTDYKRALWLATLSTFAGSLCALLIAGALIKSFSGSGLVPSHIAGSSAFLLAIALGAGGTVIIATIFGLPISTTHGLTGSLVGAGFVAVGSQVNFAELGSAFFLPLLVSPLLAAGLSSILYFAFRAARLRMGITEEYCICVGTKETVVPIPQPDAVLSYARVPLPEMSVDMEKECIRRYNGQLLGMNVESILDAAHFLSAGVVSFARGLNDTPKIVALVLAAGALEVEHAMLAVGIAIAIGGLLNARRVAETMSKKITTLNHGQGFTANLVTGLLVIFASKFGVPVSTTHVSVGSLAGIGAVTREWNIKTLAEIFASWFLTFPVAFLLSALTYWMMT